MGYLEIEANVLKVDLRKLGKKIIVLEVNDRLPAGSLEILGDMIDKIVKISLDSQVITYNVLINTKTEKPIKNYKVDESGIVSEIKPEGQQLEADLGIPKEKVPTSEVPEKIDRDIVDEFILSLLAPTYEDLPYPFFTFTDRLAKGDTYPQIAKDFEISLMKIVEVMDEYRVRIAPLAKKWNDWREGKNQAVVSETSETVQEINKTETNKNESELEDDLKAASESPTKENPDYVGKEIVIAKTGNGGIDQIEYVFPIINGEGMLPKRYVNGVYVDEMNVDKVKSEIGTAPIGGYTPGHIRYLIDELLWMFDGKLRDIQTAETAEDDFEADVLFKDNDEISFEDKSDILQEQVAPVTEPKLKDIEQFILTKKPKFDDIDFDFPSLLAKKKSGKSWMEIAREINEPSTKLGSAFTKYKNKVKDLMTGGAA